jgi:hypothetical protein
LHKKSCQATTSGNQPMLLSQATVHANDFLGKAIPVAYRCTVEEIVAEIKAILGPESGREILDGAKTLRYFHFVLGARRFLSGLRTSISSFVFLRPSRAFLSLEFKAFPPRVLNLLSTIFSATLKWRLAIFLRSNFRHSAPVQGTLNCPNLFRIPMGLMRNPGPPSH